MDVEQPNNQSDSMNIGDSLIAARQAKNLSAQDIATQLNLTVMLVEKLESNQFNLDVPVIFVRGYIASYARKVGLDTETLCQAFDQQVESTLEPIKKLKSVANFQRSSKQVKPNTPIFKLLAYLLVVVLLAVALWGLWQQFFDKKTEQSNNEILLNSEVLNQSNNQKKNQPESLSNTFSETNVQTSLVDSGVAQENSIQERFLQEGVLQENSIIKVESVEEQGLFEVNSSVDENLESNEDLGSNNNLENDQSVGLVALDFSFSADCWVKVTDINDKVLAIGVKKDGKQISISGLPPLSVVLGEPSAVNLKVRGNDFDLSSYPAGRSARLTIE